MRACSTFEIKLLYTPLNASIELGLAAIAVYFFKGRLFYCEFSNASDLQNSSSPHERW
jgi:hypothetical protein